MAIDLNDKPWYVAVIVGAVLGIALFVVLQMYVFKDMQAEIETLNTKIDELNGQNHTYYCGAYWGYGFHEDGVTSGLRVARAFGEEL